ncbi:MAG TPA: MFS transporter [Syntrophomonas sp.]|nr:MFS transporter [Syntrophomonas sp.]
MTTLKKTSIGKYELFIIITMFIAYGMVFMERFALSYVAPMVMSDLGMNNTQLGLTMSLLAVSWGISSLVFSVLSDVLNARKKVLVVLILIFSVASIGSGLATSFAFLLVTRIIMGIAEGPVNPLAQTFTNIEVAPSRRGFCMGLVQSSSNLVGTSFAAVLVIGLATSFGWRSAFYILAVPGLVLAVIFMRFLKEPNAKLDTGEKIPKPSLQSYLTTLKTHNIWICLIMTMGMMGWWMTSMTYFSVYLDQVNGFGAAQTATFLLVFGISNFVSNWLLPMISDRVGRKPVAIGASFMTFVSTLVVLYIHSFALATALLGIILVFSAGYAPLCLSIIPSESVPRENMTSALGLLVFGGEILASATVITFAGVMADKYGVSAAFVVASVSAFVALAASFLLKETAPVKLAKKE